MSSSHAAALPPASDQFKARRRRVRSIRRWVAGLALTLFLAIQLVILKSTASTAGVPSRSAAAPSVASPSSSSPGSGSSASSSAGGGSSAVSTGQS